MLPPGNPKITLFIWELKPFLSHLELRSQKTKEVVMLTRVMVLVYQMVLEALLQTVSMTWHRCVKLEPRPPVCCSNKWPWKPGLFYFYSFDGFHQRFCNQFCLKFLKMFIIITSLFLVSFPFCPLSFPLVAITFLISIPTVRSISVLQATRHTYR